MRNLFGGLILITFGVLFLLDNLGYADFGDVISHYWPLILIFWGASILIHPKRNASSTHQPNFDSTYQSSSELIHQSNVFGDIFTKIAATNFRGGSISTVFGDSTIDLSGAAWSEGDHELKIHGVFGNSLIILPKDSAVSINANSTFGSLVVLGQSKSGFSSDIQTTAGNFESTNNRLKITITKVFGDVRVE
jgi:predicted membrane protein